MADEALRMPHAVKMYLNGVMVNKDVTLSVDLGEIHALSGENRVGKSTLMKILFGGEQPISGEIFISGKQVHMSSPQIAIKMGIGVMYQHFMLVSSPTAAKNTILGIEPRKGVMVDLAYTRKQVEGMGRRCNLYVEPDKRVEGLIAGRKRKMKTLKALFRGAKILILDGPAAMFILQETQELFEELLNLKDHGYTVTSISHKLQETKQICSRVTIIRRGIVMGVYDVETVPGQDISRLMVGRDVIPDVKKDTAKLGKALVKVKDLVVVDEDGKHTVGYVSLPLRKGETLGIVEVEGNSQTELVRAITGMGVYSHGAIEISGQGIKGYSVEKIRNPKLVHISTGRMIMDMAPRLSIAENMVANKLGWKRFLKKGMRDKWAVKEYGEEMVEQYLIFCKSQDVAISSLSGGNIQGVVLTGELFGSPQVIIADQPTRGVDVGVMEFIRQRLVEMRDKGSEVTLAISDLNEALGLSDSLIVMYGGGIVACTSDTSKMTEAQLSTYMLGTRVQSKEKIEEARHEQ